MTVSGAICVVTLLLSEKAFIQFLQHPLFNFKGIESFCSCSVGSSTFFVLLFCVVDSTSIFLLSLVGDLAGVGERDLGEELRDLAM